MSSIRFTTVQDQVGVMIDRIMALPELLSLPGDIDFAIRLAVEELLANIAGYAYADSEDEGLLADVTRTDHDITITLTDRGKPFNPLTHEDPDTTLSAEEREVGGLGILLVKRLMDDVAYQYAEGQNRVTLRKSI